MLSRIKRTLRGNRLEVTALTFLLSLWHASAEAQTACTAPIVCADGGVSAPTALVGSQTQYGVAVGGTSQTVGFITPDASTTKYLKSGGASANPTWSTIATGDLPSNVMLETENANLLGSGAASNGQVLQANGSGGTSWATPTTGTKQIFAIRSETPISAGAGTLYMGLDGTLSSSEANVKTPIADTGSLDNLYCYATASPGGTSFVLTVRTGACSSLSDSTLTVTPVTADTLVNDTTHSASITAGQCASIKIVKTGSTIQTLVACGLRKS